MMNAASSVWALQAEPGAGPIERHVPDALKATSLGGVLVWQWLGLLIALVAAIVVGRALAFVIGRVAAQLSARSAATWDDALLEALRPPARFFFAVVLFRLSLELLALGAPALHAVSRLASMATIAALAWIAARIVTGVSKWLEERAKAVSARAGEAEYQARAVATQVRVLRRVANVAIGVVAVALMLTQFELVRNVGVSLLASAGLAGIVLGFAAQRTIGSLIAGIQMSATQPIAIGDVVVIEKEWGTIEEITLTFVVVKVWDERRLIIPMTRFLEHPFENWTKTSAELHGTIFLHVDWTFPVEAMRAELDRILVGHPSWDGRSKGVVVTDAKERTLQVRVLVSAADAAKLWSLRVDLREKLVSWLQGFEDGRYLPRLRHEPQDDRAGLENEHGRR